MKEPERKICWRVTRHCNLTCVHCLAGHANAKRTDLTADERLSAARVIAEVGLDRISWTGGEPTLCNDLPDLLQVMQEAKIANTVTTHGLLLRDSLLSAIDREHDCFRFSFDGLRDTHNSIRRADVFDRTLSELSRLQSLGIRVEANLSAMKRNVADLPRLAKKLAGRGASAIVIIGLMKRESAVDNNLEALSRSDFRQLGADLRAALHEFPDVLLRINDYDQEDDRYIILESDGDIVLSSEEIPDQSLGPILGSGGSKRLEAALAEHTLLHQKDLDMVAEIQ